MHGAVHTLLLINDQAANCDVDIGGSWRCEAEENARAPEGLTGALQA